MKREIVSNVYNASVIDFNLRKFHGPSFSIKNGTTYNAYVIDDEDITLIDIVEIEFFDDYISQVQEVIGDKVVKNLVINHSEPDHSSCFKKIIEMYPNINIYCTQKASEFIKLMYNTDFDNFNIVKTGDSLNTGKYNLQFIEMYMLHWPDSMATYLVEEKLLFSNDAFGQHIASNHVYDETHGLEKCLNEAKSYYANIIMPMANILKKKLDEIKDVEINIIAPSHGIIWKKYVKEIISAYYSWASFETTDKVVIVYDTMWNTTDEMAQYMARNFRDKGICVKFYKFSISEINEIMTETIDAKAIIVGSPTIYGDMLPNLAYLFEEMRVLKPKNKIGAAFGSYGWGNMANRRITSLMKELNIDVVPVTAESHFSFNDDVKIQIDVLVDEVIKKMNSKTKD